MMESLFQLLYEITLRDSVLQLISDLMIITTSITQNKQQKHSQYKDYELIYTLFIKQLRISQSSSFNILPSSFLPPPPFLLLLSPLHHLLALRMFPFPMINL